MESELILMLVRALTFAGWNRPDGPTADSGDRPRMLSRAGKQFEKISQLIIFLILRRSRLLKFRFSKKASRDDNRLLIVRLEESEGTVRIQ